MRTALLALLAAATPGTPGAALDDASRKDREQMQGDWAAVSYVRDGMPLPDDDAQALFRTVKGSEYTVFHFRRSIGRGTFTLDATQTPHTIDYRPAPRPGQPADSVKPLLGIYEWDGEKLRTCVAPPGRGRPSGFASTEENGFTLAVWEREKK
jgi:uncharacterized protein (TIGR03067 family)